MRKSDKLYKFRACKGRAISVEFTFMPGKRISTGCYDIQSAVLWTEEYLKNAGIPGKSGMPAFREFARDFFIRTDPDSFAEREAAFGRRRDEDYLKVRQSILDTYIIPQFGMMLVDSITIRMIEDWLLSLKGRNNKKDLANDTKNKILIALRFIFDDIQKKGYRNDNPAREAKALTDNGKEREALPPEQLLVLFPPEPEKRIEVWGSAMWAVYFSIFYDTGMRPGEIAAR